MNLILCLGNQLFDPQIVHERLKSGGVLKSTSIFMREDPELCTYFKFHKHKLCLFLGAMRTHAEELRESGFKVHYEKMNSEATPGKRSYEKSLLDFITKQKIQKVFHFEIEDKFFETRIAKALEKAKVEVEIWPSPMFITPREAFKAYLGKSKRPFMKTFYEQQRKRHKILLTAKGEPIGGKWSFDDQNRKPLPKAITPPSPFLEEKSTKVIEDVKKLVDQTFPDHPGETKDFWIPVSRAHAHAWLEKFLEERLANFGPYEDAIPAHSEFLFHSLLTPFLNTGLLTPSEVVQFTIRVANKKKLSINSVEGFVRQIIGWREFIHGIYQNFSEKQESTNFWNHKAKLSDVWWKGGSEIPPLDHAIEKIKKYGYAHHIERLMVAGSLMVLLEVDPKEAHRWFMEMFVDSSDWVMGPNVYGMGIFSDGGIFATKPYICGSNYYRKMGGFKAGDWCDGVDGLYWGFIEKHKAFFLKNPRLSMMARTAEKMDPERKKKLKKAAKELRSRLVVDAT
jgi:deoxyribodipyrimidine photolyase-related protein